MRKLLIPLFWLSLQVVAQPLKVKPEYAAGFWNASWIMHPTAGINDFGVYHFRKKIIIDNKPDSCIILISADNHFRLFVNGNYVANGPAKSDLSNWNYETIDIAPYLQKGENIIAATVWNFAAYRAYATISYQTGFIVQGNDAFAEMLNTNTTWKVLKDEAYNPLPLMQDELQTYMVVAQGEEVKAEKYAWNFEQLNYDDHEWRTAKNCGFAAKTRTFGTDGNWMLVQSAIPLPEEHSQRFQTIRRTSNIKVDNLLLNGNAPLTLPPNSVTSILLDQSFLTNAYPVFKCTKGKNARVTFTYAEALIDSNRVKGNRNIIDNKRIIGLQDRFIADGMENRVYSPLHFRTFRYLQINIATADEAIVINDISSIATGYPFKENGLFKTENSALKRIWETGWRTAKLCAVDTYFDCPYYEQLQYVGDTRIQALVSLYVSGDDRLMRKAIDDIAHSFIPEGLTQSRYPSRDMQVIPTFSLWWVCMLHDYYMHRKDDAFIQQHLDGVESIIKWYHNRIAKNGMLGSISWWPFVDWSWQWNEEARTGGVPAGAIGGGSSILTLQYVYTLQRAAALMKQYGRSDLSKQYEAEAKKLAGITYNLCMDEEKGMIADSYNKRNFSQHANILAILTDAVPQPQQQLLLKKIMQDSIITKTTYYFTFYLFEALKKVQLGDEFLSLLTPWQNMLDIGLTTFAEQPEPTRSDCHAWSASPNYEFLSLVGGIQPMSPAFKTVLIEPFLGELNSVEVKVPHPDGFIEVKYTREGNKIKVEITLPGKLTGKFKWRGKEVLLVPGKQLIQL